MRTKNLTWLLGATIIAIIVAVFVSRTNGPKTDPLAGQQVLPEVAKQLGDVTRMAVVHGDQKTTLVRNGDAWVVDERASYAADDSKVSQALLALADLRYVEPKTANPDSYTRLDVEDAGGKDSKSMLVTLVNSRGGLLGEVILGKHRADQLGGGEGGVYLRKPGNAQSWLARGTLDMPDKTADWLNKKLVDLPLAQVKQAVLTQADGSKVTLTRDKPEDKLRLVEMPKDKKLKYDSVLDDAAGALAGLQLDDVRSAKDFDFPKDGVTHASFVAFSGLTIAIDLADKDGVTWARFTASGSGDAQKQASDLSTGFAPWIYALSSSKAKTLRDKLDDLVEAPKAS